MSEKERLNAECRRLLKEAVRMQILDIIGPDYTEWADEVEEVVEAIHNLEDFEEQVAS